MVEVTITNNTGLRLRNVVAELHVHNGAKIEPHVDKNRIVFYDGEESWDILEPSEKTSYFVRIKRTSSGLCKMVAWIGAEVIPYSWRNGASRTFRVY